MAGGGDDNSLKAVIVAVAVNSVITVAKFVGYFMTFSPSLLAEGIHSTADVGNQFLLWVGIRKSARAADDDHPYGWGPARYLWNLKSAMGIFFLGCGVTLYHGVSELKRYVDPGEGGHSSHDAGWIGIGILAVSFVLECYSFWVAFKGVSQDKGSQSWSDFVRKGDDPTGVGVLLEDAAAVLGVLLALVGVGLSKALHNPLPDILATLLIGALLGGIAVFLARANGRLLIGASIPREDMERIKAALEADPIVERVDDLKTEILGQGRMRVKCEIDLYEKLLATRMREALELDADRLRKGEEPMRVLVDVVGRTVRLTGKEVERLERIIRKVAPTAAHIDLELL